MVNKIPCVIIVFINLSIRVRVPYGQRNCRALRFHGKANRFPRGTSLS